MNIIVTGGAGFIGSHLVDALLKRGDSVSVIDDFSSGKPENLSSHRRLTVTEFQIGRSLPEAFTRHRYDAVVHLAGLPSVSASWHTELEAHDRNLTSTLSLLAFCRRAQIPRFVFASSAAVYGLPAAVPIRENTPCRPLSPYGLQKLTSERYLELLARESGLTGVALRFFNVYGPRQHPDSPYSGVISIFADAFRKGETLTIYGDGTQTRDFIFVADVVEAISGALDISSHGGQSLILNIGTGQSRSLNDLVSTMALSFPRSKSKIVYTEGRLGDIQHSRADITALTNKLGVRPSVSLEQGLKILTDWMTQTS